MKTKIILLLMIALLYQSFVLAKEKVSTEERIIGSTFKGLAKAFAAVADIKKIKEYNINKLKKMNDSKFKARQPKIYEAIKDLPQHIKTTYGVKEDMTKEQVIKNIESLDKQKIYAIIDSVPDPLITRLFKDYLRKLGQDIKNSNMVEQVQESWNKIIRKAQKK
ncbi:MAG: hypothetical protein Q8O30_01250 [Candidatus Omnitrophota bacterium]|nr:hypothetical protein [Candidatus Omnitrophota bacterium]